MVAPSPALATSPAGMVAPRQSSEGVIKAAGSGSVTRPHCTQSSISDPDESCRSCSGELSHEGWLFACGEKDVDDREARMCPTSGSKGCPRWLQTCGARGPAAAPALSRPRPIRDAARPATLVNDGRPIRSIEYRVCSGKLCSPWSGILKGITFLLTRLVSPSQSGSAGPDYPFPVPLRCEARSRSRRDLALRFPRR